MENNVVMQLFIQRHLPDGRSLTVPCTIEVLSEKDEKLSIELHNDVASGLSRDLFAASTEEELRRFLTKDGIAVGARSGGRLVCLRTLKISPDWVRESLADYNLSPETYRHSAVTGFCVVDREFRGNNIQFLTQFYAENIVSRSFDSVITTVSPKYLQPAERACMRIPYYRHRVDIRRLSPFCAEKGVPPNRSAMDTRTPEDTYQGYQKAEAGSFERLRRLQDH